MIFVQSRWLAQKKIDTFWVAVVFVSRQFSQKLHVNQAALISFLTQLTSKNVYLY